MMPGVKVDLALDSPEPRHAVRLAAAAEALGFDGLWLTETDRDPFVALPLLAAATDRIVLGTAITVAFARSPVSLAMTAWGLAELSDGRFRLGLGTQVRGHITRRFGMPWSAPAPRLGEWVGAIRAAWEAWQTGGPFSYRSEHLDLSLMPDVFRPAPLPAGAYPIPVSVAGVGQPLARLAGRIADGFQVHPFHTRRYLDEVLEPALREGEAERDIDGRCERIVPVFVVPDGDEAVRAAARSRIAFYAATPAYRKVLELHDRGRAGERLSRLAVTGRWAEMAPLIDDDFLSEVAVVGPRDAIPDLLAARVRGVADRVMPLVPFEVAPDGSARDAASWERLISALRSA
jgi:probable F420-dependent oxidoreductase